MWILRVPSECSIKLLYLTASLCLICASTARAVDPRKPLSQYTHTVWQTDAGLPQNTVHHIVQTRDGYLWLATDGGLVRFDGIEFAVFDKQNTPAFKNNQIRNLAEDGGGNLWISTPEGLIRQQGKKFTLFTAGDGLSSSSVLSAFEDHSGTLWIITAGGLDSYRDGKFTQYTTRDGLSSDSIDTLIEDRQGSIWIGSSDGLTRFKDDIFTNYNNLAGMRTSVRVLMEDNLGRIWIGTPSGLYLLDHGALRGYTVRDGLSNNAVESIAQDSAGRIWIGTLNGLDRLDGGTITVFTTANGLPSNRIQSIYEDREHSLWISTESGLVRLEGDTFTSFAPKDRLASLAVLSICEDREGNLWLGTDSGGLHALRDNKFVAYTTEEGLSNDLVRSVYQDQSSNIWIGTGGGGLNLMRDGRVTAFTTKDGLCSNVVFATYGDRDGNLWIGTPDGLAKLAPPDASGRGRFTTYTIDDGLADNFVRSIYQDHIGQIWIGTRRGLTRLRDGKFTVYTTLDGLGSDFIGAILQDTAGTLWISTLGGLSRLKDGAFSNFTTSDGLSGNVITSLYEDRSGSLWIGTNGSGLDRFRDGNFTSVTTKDGLFQDVIYQILEDGRGNLWLSCDRGIFRVSLKDLDEFAAGRLSSITTVSYGTADGMKISECNGGGHPAGWRTRDGRLWFSTLRGVAVIDPEKIGLNTIPPPVAIDRVLVDDQAVPEHDQAEFSPGRSRFAFHYAGLSFIAPDKVQYKYKLDGFDRDWVAAGATRVAYYTNIPPGRYTFRVIACNNDGVWNEAGAAFGFHLQPHFYQTYWFYALGLMALGLIGWQLYLLRVRSIESRFAAVLAERNRIAREIHDSLAQGLAGISLQLELVAKMLASSTDSARNHLNQARILARQSLADARRSLWDLRSGGLESSDLPTSLSSSARHLTAQTGVQAQLQVSGAFRELDHLIESNLLRIGQEAITNAVKHARAQRIDISLEFDANIVRLSVRDNGRGFDCDQPPAAAGGHFGLVGMRERAEQIGGKLTVSSSPGAGTEISAEVPLEAKLLEVIKS
jgi:ligand-binding sensor domain-containing protein/two-component sensor histidine kinase